MTDISIHALLAESDLDWIIDTLNDIISIHALLAESDVTCASQTIKGDTNFYPRSPCGERPLPRFPPGSEFQISIHALLAESDHNRLPSIPSACISIHALLAESDPRSSKTARRFPYFYPRSPCGERLKLLSKRLCNALFLSTLSLRRAT